MKMNWKSFYRHPLLQLKKSHNRNSSANRRSCFFDSSKDVSDMLKMQENQGIKGRGIGKRGEAKTSKSGRIEQQKLRINEPLSNECLGI